MGGGNGSSGRQFNTQKEQQLWGEEIKENIRFHQSPLTGKSFKGEGRRIWAEKERPRVDEAEVSKLFRDWQSTVSTLISRSNRRRQVDTKQNWVRFPSTWASEAGRKLWSCVDKNQPH